MNKILFAFILLLYLSTARGQYVSIPDTAFGSWLDQNGFTSCMTGNSATGWQLDTTCSAVLDSTVLIARNLGIGSIEGVQYFKHLSLLACNGNSLTTLPPLPSSLTNLSCSENQIDSFPPLPSQLGIFICGGYPIRFFPAFPITLKSFGCTVADLDSLPPLTDSLVILNCGGNNLTSLPTLPPNLQHLFCGSNQLTVLPMLPASLTDLDCDNNQLTFLPELPDSLIELECQDNRYLSCLPQLKRIVTLNFVSTAITCLPDTNQITNSTPPLSSVPLCAPNSCHPLGIQYLSDANLKVYPNPVSDMLYIDYSIDAIYTVNDITGRACSVPITDREINVSALPAGIYLLHVQDSGGSIVSKFVKE